MLSRNDEMALSYATMTWSYDSPDTDPPARLFFTSLANFVLSFRSSSAAADRLKHCETSARTAKRNLLAAERAMARHIGSAWSLTLVQWIVRVRLEEKELQADSDAVEIEYRFPVLT